MAYDSISSSSSSSSSSQLEYIGTGLLCDEQSITATHVALKVMPRLQDLADSAMENLRHSLGQKVLMLNPEEGAAAGTTRHCISCFNDRSQSPVRGSIGNLPMSWNGTAHRRISLLNVTLISF